MSKEDYVSYELALRLKECGFDEPCDKWIASKSFSYYDEDECCDHNAVIRKGWIISQKQKERYDQDALPYLTLWQAQKWLREVKDIDVEVRVCVVDGKKGYEAYVIPPYALIPAQRDYESALSAGIAAALELIKKGE